MHDFFETETENFIQNEVVLQNWDATPEVFNLYHTQIEKMLKGISDLEVNDSDACKLALNTSSDAKKILKDIVALKKKTTEPYRKFVNLVNESSKAFTDKLSIIQEIITQKVTTYEHSLLALAETHQNEAEKLSESFDIDIVTSGYNRKQIVSTAKTIVSHKIEKSFEVINDALVPQEYFKIDEDKINKAIKLGITNIPGITIIETKKLILRSR